MATLMSINIYIWVSKGGACINILEKIKKLQKEKGLNNAQLAKKAGLSPTTLQGLYTRNNQPTFPTLQAICGAFGITIAQFFSDSNVPLDLTPEQTLLLEHWNTLTDEQKDAIFTLIKSM
jgi:transcriptional regulator with XRE-family HTH domain